MRGYGYATTALCAGAASSVLAAYWFLSKKKEQAGLNRPEAIPRVHVPSSPRQEEVASARPSSALLQLRAGVEQVSTIAGISEFRFTLHAEQQADALAAPSLLLVKLRPLNLPWSALEDEACQDDSYLGFYQSVQRAEEAAKSCEKQSQDDSTEKQSQGNHDPATIDQPQVLPSKLPSLRGSAQQAPAHHVSTLACCCTYCQTLQAEQADTLSALPVKPRPLKMKRQVRFAQSSQTAEAAKADARLLRLIDELKEKDAEEVIEKQSQGRWHHACSSWVNPAPSSSTPTFWRPHGSSALSGSPTSAAGLQNGRGIVPQLHPMSRFNNPQVAGAALQQLSQQQPSGSCMAPAPLSGPPAMAAAHGLHNWRGTLPPILTYNMPEPETAYTVYVQGVKYYKGEWLGSGGSGEVNKVYNERNQVFALKRVELAGLDAAVARMYIKDADYLLKLKHLPHVIRLIDCQVLWTQGVMYLVQECGDADLERLIQQRNAGRRAAVSSGAAQAGLIRTLTAAHELWIRRSWREMLEALHGVHEQRIVHRDLKPANFVLVRDEIKLIDFGLAMTLPENNETMIGLEAGTVGYMAPEAIWNGHGNSPYVKVGTAVDVWSLGCIMYEMVYGRQPFAHLGTNEVIMRTIRDRRHRGWGPVVYPCLANSQLVDVIKRCLDPDPDTRITVQELLAHPFLHQGQHQGPASAVTLGPSSGALETEHLAQQLQLLRAALRC